MKRFVTYLYEYKEGQKIKNTGHIRVDIRNQFLNMLVCIKQLDLKNERGTFYIIIKNEAVHVVPLEEISMQNGLYHGQISCNCYKTNIPLQNIIGVGIQYENDSYMASCWKDGAEEDVADREFLKNEKEEHLEAERQLEEKKDEVQMFVPEPLVEENSSDDTEEMMAAASVCEDHMEEVLLPAYRKINLNEIYVLPSRHWHFSNNSFLIHGFWNYGYLVLKESMEENQKRMSLGVPGIFEEPEKVMAGYFGFPEFEVLPSQMVEMEIGKSCLMSVKEENQQPQVGTFGCWFVNL